jgi:predicted metal-dependent phosphoesterase TrpH
MATVTIELPVSIEEARAEFDEAMRGGYFHPDSTFDDYLEGLYECEKEKIRAKELGLTGDEGFELTEEGERILDRMWAEIAALKKREAAATQNLDSRRA